MQLSTIGTVNKVQRCDDAQIKRGLANGLAVQYRAWRFASLAYEGRRTSTPNQSRMIEMDHTATVRDIDPALDQNRVGFAVAVFDDPIA